MSKKLSGKVRDNVNEGHLIVSDRSLITPAKSFLDDEGYMITGTIKEENGFKIEYVSKSRFIELHPGYEGVLK